MKFLLILFLSILCSSSTVFKEGERIALIYYTRGGNTGFIAKELAKELDIPEGNIELLERKQIPKNKFLLYGSDVFPRIGNFEPKDVELVKRLEAKEFDYLIFGSPLKMLNVEQVAEIFLRNIEKDALRNYGLKNIIFFQSCGSSDISIGIDSFARELKIVNKEDILGLSIKDEYSIEEKVEKISEFAEEVKLLMKKEKNQKTCNLIYGREEEKPFNYHQFFLQLVVISVFSLIIFGIKFLVRRLFKKKSKKQ